MGGSNDDISIFCQELGTPELLLDVDNEDATGAAAARSASLSGTPFGTTCFPTEGGATGRLLLRWGLYRFLGQQMQDPSERVQSVSAHEGWLAVAGYPLFFVPLIWPWAFTGSVRHGEFGARLGKVDASIHPDGVVNHEDPSRLYTRWKGMEMVWVIVHGQAKRRYGSVSVGCMEEDKIIVVMARVVVGLLREWECSRREVGAATGI
ncbi:hypothetical protein BJV78DRAFT_1327533 [Lactifluus subvellereus]|nr:hypothetical protein BJV78DRAFT_1327533 [Lactifluus subvellereus]